MSYTTSGMHPNATKGLWKYSQKEKDIVNKLSQEWYVTNAGGKFYLGETSEYKYCLIKPTERYLQMFNLEREIVVIFSHYSELEPRTLDAIHYASTKFPDLRLEKICSIIFSADPHCESKVRSLLKNDQESQIVIPINYDEFRKSDDLYFLENLFRRHFYSRDLYALESPLKKDIYFFGRSDIIHKIVSRHQSNENSALFGLRKTGKTSLIFKIERTLERNNQKSVWIDCLNTAFNKRRWNEALYYVIFLIREKYSRQLAEHAKEIGANKLKFKPEESYTEKDAAIVFESEILKLYRIFGNNSILLIFDEIERITFGVGENEHWSKGMDFVYFWGTLRSIFQKLNSVFSYLIVGTNSTCIERDLINGVDNPLFHSVPFNYIERFEVPETREMVSKIGGFIGIRFEETIYSKLTEDFGGHPFLIRHVCSEINTKAPIERPFTVDRVTYENAKKEFIEKSSGYFEMMLGILREYYKEEYQLLELLALEDYDSFNFFAEASPEYTQHLIGYGVISKNNNHYDFRIDAVKEFLASRNKYKKINLTVDEKYAECQERRVRLELKLRSLIKMVLRASVGDNQAKTAVLAKFKTDIREKIADLTLSQILNADSNQFLYFLQLKEVIVGQWEIFKHIFSNEQQSFVYKMDIVNSIGRKDTHSKTITNADMDEFRIAASWLESKLIEFEN